MNTPEPSDPRSLAHRLTTVGHALHHRLFAQLRDSDLHPKTVMVLSVIDGRLDAPWISDRIARGGKRVSALADRGWIAPAGDGWTLTDEGRQILDRVDAERQALLADVPPEQIERLTSALDAITEALGLDEDADPVGPRGPRGFGFGPGPFGPGSGRGFGPGMRGGPRFGGGEREHRRGDGGNAHHGFGPRHGGHTDGHRADGDGATDGSRHGERGHGDHGHGERGHGDHGHGDHGHRHERGHGRGHRAAERAYERGFDAGFTRGRESSASE
ncbi:MarR family winged helix-turn-helix transcriptional regulator [Microbacterium testaceum]|uniref:MarR family winged helix-turn-helix transcriptional regulator n=1 Tax=Microbacterium testaceum TaxID=2033 RepID=UPI001246D943|nr:hypothetical protein [Microbacterium testaceum]